jgi:5-formyltetrahydrofolate cyclo-ligase
LNAAGLEAARYVTGRAPHPSGTRQGIPGWNMFRSVLVFLSLPGEIDTRPLIEAVMQEGKSLFAPCLSGTPGQDRTADLAFYRLRSARGSRQAGPFGIREPPAKENLLLGPEDFPLLAFVPGLAFDRRGRRLGRGRGCYDRFFSALDPGIRRSPGAAGQGHGYVSCGLCLELQLVDAVPVESHDKKMDMILTEKGLTVCRQ